MLNPYKSLIFRLLGSQKQNENESESVILVFVLHYFHSFSPSFCLNQPTPMEHIAQLEIQFIHEKKSFGVAN